MISLYFFVFIFGAVIGSFLNVVVLRLNTGQSIVFGQSKCFSCGKKLAWHELVPIFSFLARKGRCGNCKSKISWQYPAVEIIAGSFFLLVFLKIFNHSSAFNEFLIGSSLRVLYYWIIFSFLIIIAVYDYRHQIIPNLFVWIFNFLAFAGLFFNFGHLDLFRISDFGFRILNLNNLLAGFALFAFFALLWGISKGKWMGFGDAKLALGIGWLLGMAKGVAAVTLAFWIGAIAGILLLYFSKNKYGLKSSIAFGPFMILGTIISLFFGEKIISFLF